MIQLMMRRNLSSASADEIGQMSLVKNALEEFKTFINRDRMKLYIQYACENIFMSLMFDSASRYN